MRDTLFLSFGLIGEFIFDSWMYFFLGGYGYGYILDVV